MPHPKDLPQTISAITWKSSLPLTHLRFADDFERIRSFLSDQLKCKETEVNPKQNIWSTLKRKRNILFLCMEFIAHFFFWWTISSVLFGIVIVIITQKEASFVVGVFLGALFGLTKAYRRSCEHERK